MKITKQDIALGKRIKQFRELTRLTQEQLAEKARISTTHLGLIETGKRRIGLKTLQKVAKVLNVKVRDLIPF